MSTLLASCHGLLRKTGKIIPGVFKSLDSLQLARGFAANLAGNHMLVRDKIRFDGAKYGDWAV